MKISFQTTEMRNTQKTQMEKTQPAQENIAERSSVFYDPGDTQWNTMLVEECKTSQQTFDTFAQEIQSLDAKVLQDYLIVLSHTMSAEDYAKIEEDGFDLRKMEPQEVVTIVDKIKAEMAKSGKKIVGYTDDLDLDTMANALGSMGLAQAVKENFTREDVPITEENMGQIQRAWEMVSEIQTVADSTYTYMVGRQMDPEIVNFYLAQSSGATGNTGQLSYYAEEISGYYSKRASVESLEALQDQIDLALERAGVAVNDKTRALAKQLQAGGLPLEKNNLQRLETLQEVQFPVPETAFARAVAIAVSEGREPIHARLGRYESVYEQANRLYDHWTSEDSLSEWLGMDVAARKQLEEIRLRMTAEVNVKLLESGFSIDTQPMEQLIEALRQAQLQVANVYFPQDDEAVTKYQLYAETVDIVQEMPKLPAKLLGQLSLIEQESFEQFHKEGQAQAEELRRAGERYETLLTAPRKDLGDSIQKAFDHVDDLLTSLALERTHENRKAVRILGYNSMAVDAANIERVKAAMDQVERVVTKMTPATVLQMIRDGKNPLQSNFAQLESYIEDLSGINQDPVQSYSRFLYGLEKNHEITQEERESFIGIYRLLHQLEMDDGAAVGALLNRQTQLDFSHLLSAIRSGKCKSLDVAVSDAFGHTVEVIRSPNSISDQIAKAFIDVTQQVLTQSFETEQIQADYQAQQLQQLREAAQVEARALAMLERADHPVTAENILAAGRLTDSGNDFYQGLQAIREKYTTGERRAELAQHAKKLFDTLGEERFAKEYATFLGDQQDKTLEESLHQADQQVDVMALQTMHKQMGLLRHLADAEEYVIPMELNGELTQVHLTFAREEEKKGIVDIVTNLKQEGPIEAHLQIAEGKVTGLMIANTENAVTRLQEIADIFYDTVQKSKGRWYIDRLPVVQRGNKNKMAKDSVPVSTKQSASSQELYQLAKLFLTALGQSQSHT